MSYLIKPAGYKALLNLSQTEMGIKKIKDFFQQNLSSELRLRRVTAPLFVLKGMGINDDLNGTERAVTFPIKDLDDAKAEIVHSLAKWKRLTLADYQIEKGYGIYTDMNAIRSDEYMKGVVQGEKNILFVNMAWGLGLGIIIDGNLYYGKSGFSGEFGHFCMFENEVLCHCGKKGCLETEASGSAFHRILIERYREGSNTILAGKLDSGEEISLGDLLEAVRKEDVLCIDILEKMGVNLGKGIAGLMNIFNPELVILGGTLSLAGEYISLPIKSAIRKYSLNLVNQDTEIKISKLGERAGAFGACLLSRSKLLGMIHY